MISNLDAIINDKTNEIKKMIESMESNLSNYDFKLQCERLDIKRSDGPLLRFMKYREATARTKIPVRYDCDASLLATILYLLLFDYLKGGEIIKCRSRYSIRLREEKSVLHFSGDTMTSAWAYVKKTFQSSETLIKTNILVYDNRLKQYVIPKTERSWHHKNTGMWAEYVLRSEHLEYFAQAIKQKPGLECFLENVHTLGNLTPVPNGFNINRCKNTQDRWENTLIFLYQWFNEGQKDETLWRLLRDEKAVKSCKEWLANKAFSMEGKPCWEMFINKNYFEDFLDDSGRPRWLNFEELSQAIKKRGVRMEEKLKKRLARS